MALSRSPSYLPVELLSYIFILGAHSPPEHEDERGLQELPPFNSESVERPLIYSAVCRHWRTVALNTAALWTNVCITIGSMTDNGQKKSLSPSHITSYLSLSKKCPLNILLDARDFDWDFSEPEIPTSDFSDYIPPFSENDMRVVLSLLLPQLYRWRSINILTDTWAPMHAALHVLNERLMIFGAPQLESLTLMRCNDYISHSPQFQPSTLRFPELFSSRALARPSPKCLMPRLRNVTLRGVHVDWSGFNSHLLHTSLTSLELSSHSLDIRPTDSELRELLLSCTNLESLVINGSGFISGLSLKMGTHTPTRKEVEPVELPLLKELKIGYRSATEGCDILALIHAPNVSELTLENATHPAEIEEIQADDLLLFAVGCKLDRHLDQNSSTTASPFPALRKVILKGTRAQKETFCRFLTLVPQLKSLELHAIPMLMDVIHALMPIPTIKPHCRHHSSRAVPCISSLPCPYLENVCLRGGTLYENDLRFLTKEFLRSRAECGAKNLTRLDVHLVDSDGAGPSCDVLEGMAVRIFKPDSAIDDAEDKTTETTETHLDEAFEYGGIFNDPIFDAQYSSIFSH